MITNVAPGKSDMPEVWSKCMWVMTTSRTDFGSTPLARSCAGRSSPGWIFGREKRAIVRPRLATGFAATDACRPVSTRNGPATGWRIR